MLAALNIYKNAQNYGTLSRARYLRECAVAGLRALTNSQVVRFQTTTASKYRKDFKQMYAKARPIRHIYTIKVLKTLRLLPLPSMRSISKPKPAGGRR